MGVSREGSGASNGGWGDPSKASSSLGLAVCSMPDSGEDTAPSPKWSRGLCSSAFSCSLVQHMRAWLRDWSGCLLCSEGSCRHALFTTARHAKDEKVGHTWEAGWEDGGRPALLAAYCPVGERGASRLGVGAGTALAGGALASPA